MARFGAFLAFLLTSALAGALIAATALPTVAILKVGGDIAHDAVESLPDELAIEPLAQRNNVYFTGADGTPTLMATFYDQNRVEVELDQISTYAQDAVVAAEDPRFYEHQGVDMQSTLRALLSTANGDTQGGSTITQQYVKNTLVQKCEALPADEIDPCYDAVTETSASRKLREMKLAISLEKQHSKADILRGYLNIAGFGGTVYGIETAASYYFNTTAANLTLPQAGSLIAIVNNPQKFRLDQPDDEENGAANGYQANRDRRDYILDAMLEQGKIAAEDHAAAIATPVEPVITAPTTGCQTAGGAAFFCDYVIRVLQNDPVFGETAEDRAAAFRRGGLDIYTTLDVDLQAAAEHAVRSNVPATFDGWDVGGVVSSVEVGTGRILAMAQNRDYSQDPEVQATGANYTGINYNTDYDYGGSSGFQPGSTYKAFTLAEWLRTGHDLYDGANSARKSDWGVFQDSCLGDQRYPGWNPKNDSGESGWWYSANRATIGSINTAFIGMAKELDLCGIRKTAEAFGVHRADGNPLDQGAASVLGTNEVAPLTMVAAFAGIANDGVYCAPRAIDRIVAADGTELPVPAPPCAEAIPATVAADMTTAMQDVLREGTAWESWSDTWPRAPMIGKTGTTDGNKDTWMNGASSRVATVAGVVSVTGEVNQRTVSFDSGPASTARHRMWSEVMSVANEKFGGEDLGSD